MKNSEIQCSQLRKLGVHDGRKSVFIVGKNTHLPVIQLQVDADAGMRCLEFAQQRRHVADGKRHGCADTQQALGLGVQVVELVLHVVDVVQHLLGALVILGAGFGQVDFSGGAVQQPHAKMRFKLGNVLADELG